MAVAASGTIGSERAAYAREARLARGGALAIDMLAFGVITFVVNSVYGVEQASSGSLVFSSVSSPAGYTTSTVAPWPLLRLLGLLYFMVPEALFGATPGKFWHRLRAVRLDGRPLTLRDVVIRNVMPPHRLSAAALPVGRRVGSRNARQPAPRRPCCRNDRRVPPSRVRP